ncbi:hypothetical protein BDP27DRAFT_1372708 [Rhodocollybia butyracea]|uniref:Uncharacterized protein n=1 Tax=Rhodocollybia butyracea TaxID=206335 RepID=A0A9P5TWF9_9AGAR|nr:hypothetical protein BDP27DRAFT_1372708 [Rhodocollybia butyracea]
MGDVVCLLLLCLSVMQQLLKQERSTFGNTLTKLRNRLGVQTMTSLAEVKMHVQDEHLEIETGRRTRRRFGNAPHQEKRPLEISCNSEKYSCNIKRATKITQIFLFCKIFWNYQKFTDSIEKSNPEMPIRWRESLWLRSLRGMQECAMLMPVLCSTMCEFFSACSARQRSRTAALPGGVVMIDVKYYW